MSRNGCAGQVDLAVGAFCIDATTVACLIAGNFAAQQICGGLSAHIDGTVAGGLVSGDLAAIEVESTGALQDDRRAGLLADITGHLNIMQVKNRLGARGIKHQWGAGKTADLTGICVAIGQGQLGRVS